MMALSKCKFDKSLVIGCSIACFVATGECPNEPGTLPYSTSNTLHLTVHCPAKRPQLQIISDHGRRATDFGSVCVGRTLIRPITVQNISSAPIQLASSLLDPLGPFLLLNALRALPPGSSHTILMGFSPTSEQLHHEMFRLRGGSTCLPLTLAGRGVKPTLRVSVSDQLFDMGAVLTGEYLERAFRLENTSCLPVDFSVKLESNSLVRYADSQHLPSFVQPEGEWTIGLEACRLPNVHTFVPGAHSSLVGVQNFNGQSVFDCVPQHGCIPGGESLDVVVTFAPDHTCDNYSDKVRILLFNQV